MTNMTFFVSNDLGNGHTKTTMNNETYIVPSIYAPMQETDVRQGVSFQSDAELRAYMENFMNVLDVTVVSPSLRQTQRTLVGASAYALPYAIRSHDLRDLSGKSVHDLPIILMTSLIAGQAVKTEYVSTGSLPKEDIDVTVALTTSLPITEGLDKDVLKAYENRLKQTHMVTIHNFENHPIQVRVTITLAIVALEGEAAQYAIRAADAGLAQALVADFEKHNPEMVALLKKARLANGESGDVGMTTDTIVSYKNVLGIDIGEGTTDFAVFQNGVINNHLSRSIQYGYGLALEKALDNLQLQGIKMTNRSELQMFILSQPNPMRRAMHEKAVNAVNLQLENLATRILNGFSSAIDDIASSTEIIYVYGGGATPLEPFLRKALMEKTKYFAGEQGIPVVFVSPYYAQFLNNQGLQSILSKVLIPQFNQMLAQTNNQ